MIVCGLDIETTGVDPEENYPTEVAWVIKGYDDPKPLVAKTYFVLPPEGANFQEYITPRIERITKIKVGHLLMGRPLPHILTELLVDMQKLQVAMLVTHNGNSFDLPFLGKKYERFAQEIEAFLKVDTTTDCPYPDDARSKSLLYLCAYHGFLNPFPHSALFDAMSTLKLLSCYDQDEVKKRALSPLCLVEADVSYDERHLAKRRGYSWERIYPNDEPVLKSWIKRIKECDLAQEQALSEFKVLRLNQ